MKDALLIQTLTDNETLRVALDKLQSWFSKDLGGAFSNQEYLLGGCPNALRADIESARAALAGREEGNERLRDRGVTEFPRLLAERDLFKSDAASFRTALQEIAAGHHTQGCACPDDPACSRNIARAALAGREEERHV